MQIYSGNCIWKLYMEIIYENSMGSLGRGTWVGLGPGPLAMSGRPQQTKTHPGKR